MNFYFHPLTMEILTHSSHSSSVSQRARSHSRKDFQETWWSLFEYQFCENVSIAPLATTLSFSLPFLSSSILSCSWFIFFFFFFLLPLKVNSSVNSYLTSGSGVVVVGCPSQDRLLNLAYTLGTFFNGFTAFIWGFLLDRWGLRIVRLIIK